MSDYSAGIRSRRWRRGAQSLLLASCLGIGIAAGRLDAQAPPKADVTAVADTSPVKAGTAAQLVLRVVLPANVHVQSDKPRDPLLIPTSLTLKPPAGITVDEIVFPKATDLVQAGRKEPLAVFSGTFTIVARVTVASSVAAGDTLIPGQFRYQACDERLCYAPARVDVQWTRRITR